MSDETFQQVIAELEAFASLPRQVFAEAARVWQILAQCFASRFPDFEHTQTMTRRWPGWREWMP